jgi:hypothetical protein
MGKNGKKYGLGKRGGEEFEHKLPSGEECLMRAISIEDMLEMGITDRIDSLSAIVQVEHIDRVAGKSSPGTDHAVATLAALNPSTAEGRAALLSLLKDKERWTNLLDFVDKVVLKAVVEPSVYDGRSGDQVPHHVLENGVDVHAVDLQDKLSIMNAAMTRLQGGVVAAEPFREGREDDVADVPDVEGLRYEAERPTRGDSPSGG